MMDSKAYLQTVRNRATTDYPKVMTRLNNKQVQEEIKEAVKGLIESGTKLDKIKKHLMYGHDKMVADTQNVLPANNVPQFIDIVHSIIGINTEAPELGEILLKILDNPNNLDVVNFKEELGDVAWYEGLGILAVEATHEEVWTINDDKLEERMKGKGFSAEGALNRNIAAEKAVMEKAIAETAAKAAPFKPSRHVEWEGGAYFVAVHDSSQIQGLEYKDLKLTVHFKSKAGVSSYKYSNVPVELFWQLAFSDSLGKVFASTVKAHPEVYPFEKIN